MCTPMDMYTEGPVCMCMYIPVHMCAQLSAWKVSCICGTGVSLSVCLSFSWYLLLVFSNPNDVINKKGPLGGSMVRLRGFFYRNLQKNTASIPTPILMAHQNPSEAAE